MPNPPTFLDPVPEPLAAGALPAAGELALVHADDHLLVFDKPAGLLSVPGRGPDKQDCLSARALRRYPDALVVHRLDMATSGLLLMARGPVVQRLLSAAFATRRVHKRYVAVVDGEHRDADGWQVIESPIAADWARRPLRVIDSSGQPSTTRWRVIERLPRWQACRVELEPVTGRTHQLRVHMASVGGPILGDTLYAPGPVARRADRLLLHACSLELAHPVTGVTMRFESPAPFGEFNRP